MEKKIDPSNIGYKLLKSMGWKEGKSLGKHNKGILEPIKIDIENKISKENNKNYKNKKKSKNYFTLSSFKSKLYNTKELINEKKIQNEQKNLKYNPKDNNNHINFLKNKNLKDEKIIKNNISILINIIYNKYFLENENEYLILRNKFNELNKFDNFQNFINDQNFTEEILEKLIDLANKLENICEFFLEENEENNFGLENYNENMLNKLNFKQDDIEMDNIKNNIDSCGKNDKNGKFSDMMFLILEIEDFLIVKKFMKILSDEILKFKIQSNNINSNDFTDFKNENKIFLDFSEIYFENIEKLRNLLDYIIKKIFFYCSICSIYFDNFYELEIHMENECAEDLSE